MKAFQFITVFARVEHNDVQVYHDKRARRPFGRFMHWSSNKPTRRNKYVTLNCFKYRLVWLEPMKGAQP